MSQGTEHHVEEAEHAQHAAHNPFDRKVALSMAIVAAALASVTLLSHRSHNEVTVMKTEESDAWNFYQAKKNRGDKYAADAELLAALSKETSDSEAGGKKRQSLSRNGKTRQRAMTRTRKNARRRRRDFNTTATSPTAAATFRPGRTGDRTGFGPLFRGLLAKRHSFWIIGILVAHGLHRGDGRFLRGTATAFAPCDLLRLEGCRPRIGLAAAVRFHERLHAQSDKDAAQNRHRRGTDAGCSRHVHSLGEFVEEASGSGEKAQHADDGRRVHGVFAETLLLRYRPENNEYHAHAGRDQGGGMLHARGEKAVKSKNGKQDSKNDGCIRHIIPLMSVKRIMQCLF